MLAFFDGRIAKWQIPDDVVFVSEIPHTATGKIQKLKLRDQFKDHPLPTAVRRCLGTSTGLRKGGIH
jgi:acyl-CoA synthetase (AMP-forming)/AMP-acid ligase II